MKRIYKYPLNLTEHVTVVMLPINAEILHIDSQRGYFHVWALVDIDKPVDDLRIIVIYGTGHDVEEVEGTALKHINTFLVDGGVFVWHAFERVQEINS